MTLLSWRTISSSHIATRTVPPSSLIADPPKCRRERAAPKCSKEVESVQSVFIVAATQTMFPRRMCAEDSDANNATWYLRLRKPFHLSVETTASDRKTTPGRPGCGSMPIPYIACNLGEMHVNNNLLYAQKLCRNWFGRVIGSI